MSALLPFAIVCLTVVAIISAAVLIHAAAIRPPIGALTERAAMAVLIAVFGMFYSVVVINTEIGMALFSLETGRLIGRLVVVALLLLPAYWTALYLTGNLGGRE